MWPWSRCNRFAAVFIGLREKMGGSMWYMVSGTLNVWLHCDCPHCDGDVYRNGQNVTLQIQADSPEEAADAAMNEICAAMSHDDASVDWRDKPEVLDYEIKTDILLRKLGAVELPLEVR